ncbi:MAG: GroL [Firmicutes bacterium]|nr:GroL [Bacillota bacterium]
MTTGKQAEVQAQADERIAALISNANAVHSAAAAVAGTVGPKGLDTMLVDRNGETIITNDGITILTRMEASHPAARMLVNAARAQEEEVGDGTTTTTILAAAILSAAVAQVTRGVPVARVIEGVHLGVRHALQALEEQARPVGGIAEPVLRQVALVAGRGHADIADLVLTAAGMWGQEKFADPTFKLADCIFAEERAANEVFHGVVIQRERLDRDGPGAVAPVRLLVLDDALVPEELDQAALSTDVGFRRYIELVQEFRANIRKLAEIGVNLVVTDRSVDDWALEALTDAGVMVVHRVAMSEWRRVAEHTGARVVRRTALRKPAAELARYLGHAERACEDERLGHVRILGGQGKPMATVLVGAVTAEVVAERERIARDAAASVQAAIREGVVPGGGAIELHAARMVEQYGATVKGMAAYGVQCVADALRRPLWQIVANAGYNPLEKVGDVLVAQGEGGSSGIAVDCDTGELADMWLLGVVDPALVKRYALRTAGEIAEAILRIDTIIRMKGDRVDPPA